MSSGHFRGEKNIKILNFSKFEVFSFEINSNYYFSGFERHEMLQIEVGIMKNNKKNKKLQFLHEKIEMQKNRSLAFQL